MSNSITVPLEVKALGKREFEGYGSIFGNKDLGDDIVVDGAFTKTLSEHKSNGSLPMMFWMHDPAKVPGKWVEMSEDSNGLYVKGVLADTPLGNEIHTLLGMKAVSGLSIGYITKDSDFTNDGVRLLKEVELAETSIVSIPMNPKANIVHAKSRLSERGEYVPTTDELAALKRDTEAFFRSKGFSKNLAIAYVSNLFKESGATLDQKTGATLEGESMTTDDVKATVALEEFKDAETRYELNKILDKYIRS